MCEFAVEVGEARRRQILELDWLLEDSPKSGPTTDWVRRRHEEELVSRASSSSQISAVSRTARVARIFMDTLSE